jgi:hypothetical protein
MNAFDQHLSILYAALSSECGLVVATSSPNRTRIEFERAKNKDPGLAGLHIMVSKTQPNSEVWIVKDAQRST